MRNYRLRYAFLDISLTAPLPAQLRADKSLAIDRLFSRADFRSAPRPTVHWLKEAQ
jgi:hypothetical protein